jgi:hypothetical protein
MERLPNFWNTLKAFTVTRMPRLAPLDVFTSFVNVKINPSRSSYLS